MDAHAHAVGVIAALIALGTCSGAAAQAPPDRSAYVGVKGGVNHEQAEDALSGTAGAGGVVAGIFVGRAMRAEVELWVPTFIRPGPGDLKHRDTLLSINLVHSFQGEGSRPYVLAGISSARTEDYLTSCIADRVPQEVIGATEPEPTIVDCSEPDVRERRRERFTSSSSYLVLGAGMEVSLGSRVRLAPEVRMHLALGSVIVRPAVGLVVLF